MKLPIPGDALLETIGRRTGQPRYTPVCDGLDGEIFWLVSQRGRHADWVRNIEANPRVRVKVRGGPRARWRAGTAHIVDGDDPRERQRILTRGNLARRLCVCTSKAVATSPLTVRVASIHPDSHHCSIAGDRAGNQVRVDEPIRIYVRASAADRASRCVMGTRALDAGSIPAKPTSRRSRSNASACCTMRLTTS